MPDNQVCLFCTIPNHRIVASNHLAYAIWDGFQRNRLIKNDFSAPVCSRRVYASRFNSRLGAGYDYSIRLTHGVQLREVQIAAIRDIDRTEAF